MGAQEKLDKVLARQGDLAALIETTRAACETAVEACKAAEQARANITDLRREISNLTGELQGQGGVLRGWLAELDKSIKSAARGLHPSRVEALLDRFAVAFLAAIAVLVLQYLVAVVRNLL